MKIKFIVDLPVHLSSTRFAECFGSRIAVFSAQISKQDMLSRSDPSHDGLYWSIRV